MSPGKKGGLELTESEADALWTLLAGTFGSTDYDEQVTIFGGSKERRAGARVLDKVKRTVAS